MRPISLVACLPAVAYASSLNERTIEVCKAVDLVVNILKAYPSASPFCSKFLGIPTATTVITTTTTDIQTSFVPTIVPTVISTFTVTDPPITEYSPSVVTVTSCLPNALPIKRGLERRNNAPKSSSKSSSSSKKSSSSIKTSSIKTSSVKSSSVKSSSIKTSSIKTSSVKSSSSCKTTSSVKATSSKPSSTLMTVTSSNAITASTNCPGCPNVLNKIACKAISDACKCLSIQTPTTTVVATTVTSTTELPITTEFTSIVETVTVTGTTTLPSVSTVTINECPKPSLCGNKGIQFAYYGNEPYGDNIRFMDATYMKQQMPDYQGTTTKAGGIDNAAPASISIYGSPPLPNTYFVLNHKGYIFAAATGTYTFRLSQLDDIAYLWLGPAAFAGWTGDPYGGNFATRGYLGQTVSTTRQLNQGEYLPFRVVFGQQGGPVVFRFTVLAPDGTVVLDRDTSDSDYVVQYSCDGVLAPPFPPFGGEI